MPKRIIEHYKPWYSKRIKDELVKPQAKDFTIGLAKYAKKMFMLFDNPDEYNLLLDYTSLGVALNSAYIDIFVATSLHEMDGGPAPAKHGAAVASWLNTIKPIQFTKGSSEKCVYINAHWALLTGLMVKFGMEKKKGDLSEVLLESGALNDLIYTMVWRSPSYRELSTLFRFI